MLAESTCISTTKVNSTEARPLVGSTATRLTASLTVSGSTTIAAMIKIWADGSWKAEWAAGICALVACQCQSDLSRAAAPFYVGCQVCRIRLPHGQRDCRCDNTGFSICQTMRVVFPTRLRAEAGSYSTFSLHSSDLRFQDLYVSFKLHDPYFYINNRL